MLVLGLNAYHGDSAACLVRDGGIVAAAEEERFRRIKHWAGFPSEAIRYCLAEAGVGLEAIDRDRGQLGSKRESSQEGGLCLAQRPDLASSSTGSATDASAIRSRLNLAAAFPGARVPRHGARDRASSRAPCLGLSRFAVRGGGRRFGRWLRRFCQRGLGCGARAARSRSTDVSTFRIRSASSIRR